MSRASSFSILARLGAVCSRSWQAAANGVASTPSCSFSLALSNPLASVRSSGVNSTSSSVSIGLAALLPTQGQQVLAVRGMAHRRREPSAAREPWPSFFVSPGNLRDNPGATQQRIRVGRGDSSRRGNYSGRGMKGQKARGRGPHLLFDGGQLGWLKFPVQRQRPSYEVLYNQLGISRVVEWVQLGLLDPSRTITIKDLYDSGCVTSNIKYGVLLYGKARLAFPLDIQVTACDSETRTCVEAAGGCVSRVYYEREGLQAVLHPEKYTSRRLPLPLPAVRWHPKYDGKFDEIGQIPPSVRQVSAPSNAGPGGQGSAQMLAAA